MTTPGPTSLRETQHITKDPNTGIEVVLKPLGSLEQYPEWRAPPNAPGIRAEDRNDCFIEAVAGQCFALQVTVPATFDWMGFPALRVELDIDGGTIRNCIILTQQRPLTLQFAKAVVKIDGTWCDCFLTFAEITMSDDPSSLTRDQAEAQIALRGRIDVSIGRGSTVARPTLARDEELEHAASFQAKGTSVKKVVIDNGRSHYVTPVSQGPTPLDQNEALGQAESSSQVPSSRPASEDLHLRETDDVKPRPIGEAHRETTEDPSSTLGEAARQSSHASSSVTMPASERHSVAGGSAEVDGEAGVSEQESRGLKRCLAELEDGA
ncbi:hypothetical protein LTR85_003718 [Meristemomyces frigidus]|nr:hypothetical protein LTR85_003718 [Meristemomyces frigidus]